MLLNQLGADVALYTNCDFFDFHEEVIMQTVSTLCVPLDGASEYVHDRVRGRDNHRAVLSVLDRHAHGGIKIKAGTVVGRHNIYELDGILYTLERYKIEGWNCTNTCGTRIATCRRRGRRPSWGCRSSSHASPRSGFSTVIRHHRFGWFCRRV